MKEFTGFYDKNHKKLYVGDKVIADTNNSTGTIGKHQNNWSTDNTIDEYHVSWNGIHENLGGVTNSHITKK